MKIGSFSPIGNNPQHQPTGAEKVERDRPSGLSLQSKDQPQVAPEEILDKIKDLTEGGLHSVRFEMEDDINTLVVKVFDRETEELVRQVPAKELLDSAKHLRDYRGLIVNDKG